MIARSVKLKHLAYFRAFFGVNDMDFMAFLSDSHIRKDLDPSDAEHTSIFSVYLPNKSDESDDKKRLIIDANYGERRDEGVSIRAEEKTTVSAPIDLISSDANCQSKIETDIVREEFLVNLLLPSYDKPENEMTYYLNRWDIIK